MSRIEQIVMDYFNHNDLNLYNLIKFLEQNDTIRYQIYREMEKYYHKEDIQNEIDYMNGENDTNYTFTNEEMDLILEDYEDSLGDSEEWAFRLRNVLERWFEDKEDELKLSYDCDSGDITYSDFKLSNAMISGINLNDVKYIDVEYEDDVLTWIIIFLKDTTTAFEIKFTV